MSRNGFLYFRSSSLVSELKALTFLPSSRWLLNNIDGPTHFWVIDNLSKFVRDIVFEIGVSNISIVLGCLGWALASSILLNDAIDERTGTLTPKDLGTYSELPHSCAGKLF